MSAPTQLVMFSCGACHCGYLVEALVLTPAHGSTWMHIIIHPTTTHFLKVRLPAPLVTLWFSCGACHCGYFVEGLVLTPAHGSTWMHIYTLLPHIFGGAFASPSSYIVETHVLATATISLWRRLYQPLPCDTLLVEAHLPAIVVECLPCSIHRRMFSRWTSFPNGQ